MKCEDCGFEYAEGKVCPRCGYDPSFDFIACVTLENPPIANKFETELNAFCQKAQDEHLPKEKIQEKWNLINEKAKAGDLDARHLFGRVALSRKDFQQAHRILAPLADAGHALAQIDLAKIYAEGLGIDPDPYDAIKLYRLAAAKGSPFALFKLAEMHAGNGMLRNDPMFANALMQQLVTIHPTMFQRKAAPKCQSTGCSCSNEPTNKEFATRTAFEMSRLLRYAIILGLLAFVAYIVWTEFMR